MEMGYFKQKIYETSEDPKSGLEKINEDALYSFISFCFNKTHNKFFKMTLNFSFILC